MKIEKYVKGKNGMYTISFDNGNSLKIHEDLILKYGLLLSKEITEEVLEDITSENRIYEIYNIALKYIKVRLRSTQELQEYLKKKGYDNVLIEEALVLLKKQGYLEDSIFAASFIHDKILMSHYGPNKMKGELEKLGIAPEIILDKMEVYTEEMEKERIEKLVEKQIQTNHHKSGLLLKKKIQTNLMTLGYRMDLINDCLNHKDLYNPDIYQKEYQKIYNKLSKKYTGSELEYRVKQKLYQLGFSNQNFD